MNYHTVIVKSTVIPGTTVGIVRTALESASGKIAGQGFGLALQLHFRFEMGAACFGLVSSSPE